MGSSYIVAFADCASKNGFFLNFGDVPLWNI